MSLNSACDSLFECLKSLKKDKRSIHHIRCICAEHIDKSSPHPLYVQMKDRVLMMESWDDYIAAQGTPGTHVDHRMLGAAAKYLDKCIEIVEDDMIIKISPINIVDTVRIIRHHGFYKLVPLDEVRESDTESEESESDESDEDVGEVHRSNKDKVAFLQQHGFSIERKRRGKSNNFQYFIQSQEGQRVRSLKSAVAQVYERKRKRT